MPSVWCIEQFEYLENSSSDREKNTRRESSGVNSKRPAICHHRPGKKPVTDQLKALSSSAVQPPNQRRSSGATKGERNPWHFGIGAQTQRPNRRSLATTKERVDLVRAEKNSGSPRCCIRGSLSLERERVEWSSRLKLARASPLFPSTSNRYNAPSFTCMWCWCSAVSCLLSCGVRSCQSICR